MRSKCRPALAAPISICGPVRLNAWLARRQTPVVTPDPTDKRFADPEWSQNQFFDFLKQAYLLTAQWGRSAGKGSRRRRRAHPQEGRVLRQDRLPTRSRRRISCLPIRNCCARRLSSNAENLVRGMHMLTEDIKAGHGKLKSASPIHRCSRWAEISRSTPGKVDLPERPDAVDPI